MSDLSNELSPTTAPADNGLGWILCAPAAAAMIVLNLFPAGGALLETPPLQVTGELAAWGNALLVIGRRALAMSGTILAIEIPLAFYLAIVALRSTRSPRVTRTPALLFAATVAGFSWRLLFGGSIGFVHASASTWTTVFTEVWRSLPLTTLLFYATLERTARDLAQVARSDGATLAQVVRRIYVPLCKPAMLLLVGLRIVDYLRAVNASAFGIPAAERAVWTLLVLGIAILAVGVAQGRETPR